MHSVNSVYIVIAIYTLTIACVLKCSMTRHRTSVAGLIPAGKPIVDEFFSTVKAHLVSAYKVFR